jgi:periplasmic protein TonB
MTLEVQRVSSVPEDAFGSLSSCLVEGDPQSEKRARRIKQRAVAVSIVLQSLALVALVLFPLLSKGECISLIYVTPIPPYAPIGNHRQPVSNPGQHTPAPCHFCQPPNISPTVVIHDPAKSGERDDSPGDPIPGVLPTPGANGGGIHPPETHPIAPDIEKPPVKTERRKVSEMQQMAQLITRVEPRYPPLAIQIHREGRVELHALISTTGTIESLEAISGDPFFIQSALAAVREWRYRPTILNGHPIEVDTRITVIYTLSR